MVFTQTCPASGIPRVVDAGAGADEAGAAGAAAAPVAGAAVDGAAVFHTLKPSCPRHAPDHVVPE